MNGEERVYELTRLQKVIYEKVCNRKTVSTRNAKLFAEEINEVLARDDIQYAIRLTSYKLGKKFLELETLGVIEVDRSAEFYRYTPVRGIRIVEIGK